MLIHLRYVHWCYVQLCIQEGEIIAFDEAMNRLVFVRSPGHIWRVYMSSRLGLSSKELQDYSRLIEVRWILGYEPSLING
jgi:hypothetical protein